MHFFHLPKYLLKEYVPNTYDLNGIHRQSLAFIQFYLGTARLYKQLKMV